MTHSGQKDSLRMWFLLLPHVHSLFPPIKPYHFSTGTSYCWLGSTCAGREGMYLHSQAFPIWYLMLCCCVAFIACNTELVCNLTRWHRGWGDGFVVTCWSSAAIWLTVLSVWHTTSYLPTVLLFVLQPLFKCPAFSYSPAPSVQCPTNCIQCPVKSIQCLAFLPANYTAWWSLVTQDLLPDSC